MLTDCPDCGAEHLHLSKSHESLFYKNLIAATCDCWTGYRIYDQKDGRLLSFTEMTHALGLHTDIRDSGFLDFYLKNNYESSLFKAHDTAEAVGEWVTIQQMHNILCEDPRVLRISGLDLQILYGEGGGTLAERLARRDREIADLDWIRAFFEALPLEDRIVK